MAVPRTWLLRTAVVAGVIWTLLAATAFVLLRQQIHASADQLARAECDIHFKRDNALRRWVASHGGCYVVADSTTPPNPYLTVPNREIPGPDGTTLTLMNPAYVVRQINARFGRLYGVVGDLTSLKPINPGNAPDPWQREALEAMEAGEAADDVVVSSVDGRYLRALYAFRVVPECLKCHGHQGYQIGDVRGGIGVAVPLAPYREVAAGQVRATLAVVGGIWLVGMLFGAGGFRTLHRTREGEREALQRAGRARRIVENSACVIFSWRPEAGGPVNFVTENVAAWGVAAEDLLSGKLSYLELIHPDDRRRVEAEVDAHVKAGAGTFYQSYRIITPDGQERSLADWTVIEYGRDGTVEAILGIVVDISELQEARRELHLSHERLRLVLEGAELGSWDWNARTGEVVFDERWASMVGVRLSDLSPHVEEWSRRVHPDDLDPTMKALQDHLEGRTEVYESLHRMRHADGSWRWILDRGRVVERQPDGSPIRVTGTHLDMTERKRTEMLRRELDAKYQQAARLQSMGLLTGGIAHDFNNQLQVIRGNAELLAQDAPADDQRLFDSILGAVDHSAALCDRMLVYAGQHQLQDVQNLDLAEELAQIVADLGELGRGVTVETSGAGVGASVDRRRFHELMRAILENAREACADLPVIRIRVTVDEIDTAEGLRLRPGRDVLAPGKYVRINVTDSGCGMNEEILSHATEPFYTTKFLGRGLGLAVAATLVKQHGGGLDMQSRPQEGTTVTVILPVSATPSPEPLT